ncbi:hypothetical protein TraAM80_07827 [Trypanosoma rangeli]|uniref:Uncharacterized protein n=1 Tax=Trypanosoma rangeli TaxID=5698 RepID=A0A422N3M6_TRYRA|nr:uncharacterized protein TraAM80_07827 [Trypanosoma rangeli]RNF00051.1 hypothetical protein TraAM80_07827 [Trypanosoma rangeli]|eukprot:RNF00051.1 hypothetical protein TraAM80_07827 [Trypanosoma rangeli]
MLFLLRSSVGRVVDSLIYWLLAVLRTFRQEPGASRIPTTGPLLSRGFRYRPVPPERPRLAATRHLYPEFRRHARRRTGPRGAVGENHSVWRRLRGASPSGKGGKPLARAIEAFEKWLASIGQPRFWRPHLHPHRDKVRKLPQRQPPCEPARRQFLVSNLRFLALQKRGPTRHRTVCQGCRPGIAKANQLPRGVKSRACAP